MASYTVLLGTGSVSWYNIPTYVLCVAPRQMPLAEVAVGTGTFEARMKTAVEFRISGTITEVLADQGDSVRKDQVIGRLYSEDWKQKVAISEAELAIAKNSVSKIEHVIVSAAACAEYASANYIRTSKLIQSNAVPRKEYEENQQLKINAVERSNKHCRQSGFSLTVQKIHSFFRL